LRPAFQLSISLRISRTGQRRQVRALRIKGNSNMCCFVSVNADDILHL
jgi:hypothetical protein